LPQNFGFGTGYYQYGKSADISKRQWGTQKTIQTLVEVCRQFKRSQFNYDLITDPTAIGRFQIVGIGDISFKFGVTMSPHKSHTRGVHVDVRPCRKDGTWGQVTFRETKIYDQEKTKILIQLFLGNPNVEGILFDDPDIYKLPGVSLSPEKNHDNHFHINMKE
jgi:hypothetical protein